MGCCASSDAQRQGGGFQAIADKFRTLAEVQEALRKAGLESSNLIVGIDFTKSNEWTGRTSFGGRSLHYLAPGAMNPYQSVIDLVARTLEPFDDDHLIPAYGFGDVTTTDRAVFPFYPDERPCYGVAEVLQRYSEIAPHVQLSGPTSFEPIISKAIDIVARTKQYHILVIVADGQVSSEIATREAILRASGYPLSIVLVGVGDGPWDKMREFDDGLPQRKFDNFQFVNFHDVMARPGVENYEVEFAVAALMEIPDQYQAIKRLHLL
eukprot:m51a1_g6238 hypothetical protein (266) ;mRNA; f:5399-6571